MGPRRRRRVEARPALDITLIGYTTRYRGGGAQLQRAAEALARRERARGATVRCIPIERKHMLLQAFADIAVAGDRVAALHLLTHAGMYGPMFGTTAWPEQMSPAEWRATTIPFAPGAEAFFHACRTARWFAPFFARTFGVPAHGYHWYTTFSGRLDRYARPRWRDPGADVYLVGFPGRTSHGLWASVGKYAGLTAAEPLQRFEPPAAADGAAAGSYDGVAALYDAVFDDITIRAAEVAWLEAHLHAAVATLPEDPCRPDRGRPRLLDLGCGNGALLQRWAGRVGASVGVDGSAQMLEQARRRNAHHPHLRFVHVDGPSLPLADASVDIAVSLLSFRYLDWDPLMRELRRVLVPGGRLLVVDMAAKAPTAAELPRLLADKVRTELHARRRPGYRRALAALVADPRWQAMLQYNPIRAWHEYAWYLQSRFPGRQVETLNIARTARVLAFDSGPIAAMRDVELTWP